MEPILVISHSQGNLWQVDGAFSPAECSGLIRWAEEKGYSATGAQYPPRYRNNDRLVVDDPLLAESFWRRLETAFPAAVTDTDGTVWHRSGLNPRFRSCRYRDGQAFCVHQDGAFSPSENQRSWFTFMVYLNDGADFHGGATRFLDGPEGALLHAVSPRTGRVVIFDHRLWHDGEAVNHGAKYVLRSDVMYQRADDARLGNGHLGYVFCVRFSSDGTVWSGGRDSTVRTWDGARVIQVFRGHPGSVTTVLPVDGGAWCGHRDGTWRRVDGGAPAQRAHEGTVLSSDNADGTLLTAGADGRVARWSADGECLASHRVHNGWVWTVRTVSNGFITGGEDQRVARWSVDGALRWRWEGAAPVRALDAWDDVVTAGDSAGSLHVLVGGGLTQRHELHHGAITSVRHVGASRICTGGEDGRIRLLNLSTGQVSDVGAHDGMVRSLDFREGVLASGSYDGTVRRWAL